MVTRKLLAAAAAALMTFGITTIAAADEGGTAPVPASTSTLTSTASSTTTAAQPMLHHAPKSFATAATDLLVEATIDRPDRLRRAFVVYRHGGELTEIPFERSSSETHPYVAVIPAKAVRGPDLAYAIELEPLSGERVAVFASRAAPHPITVLDEPQDADEARLLRRVAGRRSVVSSFGEYVYFGNTEATVRDAAAPGGLATKRVRDEYYRVEGAYTYRSLRTVAEFGIRAGMVRGRSVVEKEQDPSKFDVGLNYAAPRVRVRADDWLHFEGEFLTSVTEVGFSVGGGGAVLLGDPYGSRLTLGFEAIEVFGARGYSRMDLVANRWLRVAPIVEVTTMPHADRAGLRLMTEAGIDVSDSLAVALRGGYQARDFQRGGASAAATVSYAF